MNLLEEHFYDTFNFELNKEIEIASIGRKTRGFFVTPREAIDKSKNSYHMQY